MTVAYVDTSVLTAIAFDEPGAESHAQALNEFDRLISSNLLEAELRVVFAREKVPFQENLIAGVEWVLPNRSLAAEFATVLEAGYSRGADLWHVASALYISPQPDSLSFATLDARQNDVAKTLGFPIPWEEYLP